MDNREGHDRSVSIIIPVFNEALTIEKTLQELYDVCLSHLTNFELILLEDGSSDNTVDVLKNCEKKFPNVILHTSEERIGYRTHVTQGFQMATKEWVLLMDGDGQIEPADIWALLAQPASTDIVTAVKFPRCDPMGRIFISRCFDFITDLTLGINIKDINFGFKLMRTKLVQEIAPQCGTLGEIFTAEIVVRFVYSGYSFNQIRVRHRKRLLGPSQGIPPTRVIGRGLYTFGGLFKLRKELANKAASS